MARENKVFVRDQIVPVVELVAVVVRRHDVEEEDVL